MSLYNLKKGQAIDNTNSDLKDHGIDFSGSSLPVSSNVLRGTSIVPTRVSGWVCFTGTLSSQSAYMDYFSLTTEGTEICYGRGSFAFAESGADVAVILGSQTITRMNSGSTLATASGSPLNGAYAAQFKMLFDGATIESGAITAVACFLYQANVTDVSNQQSSILQLSVDSGDVQNIFHINVGAGALAHYLFNVSEAAAPFMAFGGDNEPNAASADLGIRCMVGASEYWIPLYINT